MTVKELIEALQKCPPDMFVETYSESIDITSKVKYISREDEKYNLVYLIIA